MTASRRRALRLRVGATFASAVVVFLAWGCASATFAVAPSSSTPKDRADQRYVLVEATGHADEVDVFVSSFLSAVNEKSDARIVDARLSGARLSALQADFAGEIARGFQREWPSDVYVGVTLSECETTARQTRLPGYTDRVTGQTQEIVSVGYQTECLAHVTLVSAKDGRTLATVAAKGERTTDPAVSRTEESIEGARRDSALAAAKKLFGATRR